jgi:hypothetical protein
MGDSRAPDATAKRYDAFVSYSHSADGEFAPALQEAMQRLAKPWRQRRALEVFRDQTGLAVNPDLWAGILTALDASEWFVLLASPQASGSIWVGKEIEHCIATKGPDRVVIVLTDGTLAWDHEAGDFAESSTAVHPALRGLFDTEPRWVDLSWAKRDTDLTLRNLRFRDRVAEIVAPMHGVAKDDLVGEDVRQQRRRTRLVRGAVAALAVLTVLSTAGSVVAAVNQRRAVREAEIAEVEAARAEEQAAIAEQERARAEEEAAMAMSRELAAISTAEGDLAIADYDPDTLDIDHTLPRLLAAQAYRIAPTREAAGALLEAVARADSLTGTAGEPVLPDHLTAQRPLATTPDAGIILTDSGGQVGVFDATTGEHRMLSASSPAWPTPDGSAVVTHNGWVIDVASDETTHMLPPLAHAQQFVPAVSVPSFDPTGRWMAYVESPHADPWVFTSPDGRNDPVRSDTRSLTDPNRIEHPPPLGITVVDLESGLVARHSEVPEYCYAGACHGRITHPPAISSDGQRVAFRVDLGTIELGPASPGDVSTVVSLERVEDELVVVERSDPAPGGGFLRFTAEGALEAHDGETLVALDPETLDPGGGARAAVHRGRWSFAAGGERILVTPQDGDCGGFRLLETDTLAVAASVDAVLSVHGTQCDTLDAAWLSGGDVLLVEARDRQGGVHAIPTDPEELLVLACAAAGRDLTEEEWATYLPDMAYEPTCSDLPDVSVGGEVTDPDEVDGDPTEPDARGDRPDGAPPEDDLLVVSPDGLSHPDLSLGAPFEPALEALVGRYGPSTDTGFHADECLQRSVRTVAVNGETIKLTAFDEADPRVDAITVLTPDIPTAEGLHVGDPGTRVGELYPESEFEAFGVAGASALWVVGDGAGGVNLVILATGGTTPDTTTVSGFVIGELALC